MHGLGAGDVNGDGRPDILTRNAIYLQQADGSCLPYSGPGVGCIQATRYDAEAAGNRGGSLRRNCAGSS